MKKGKKMIAFIMALALMVTATTAFDAGEVYAAPASGSYNTMNGVDVSEFQGNINWNTMKAAGVQFAIIRVGIRDSITGKIKEDKKYAQNIQGALNAGLRVGVYIFSQAVNQAEAVEEAEFLISRVYKYNITLPLVMDYEFNSNTGARGRLKAAGLSKDAATANVVAFSNRVQQAGYTAMVYANKNYLTGNLNASTISANKCRIWLAHYTGASNYKGVYDFWQYSSKASGASYGCTSTYVDVDKWYDDGTIFGADYSCVFDPKFYAKANQDVAAVYGNNVTALLQHFINTGMNEQRRGNETFNVVSYRNAYPDLRESYGMDWKKYYEHYMKVGRFEGRVTSGYEDTTLGYQAIYEGVDYTAVFDPAYYASHNGDILAAFGYDYEKLLNHFVQAGMAEGRESSPNFSVSQYKAKYADIAAAFGEDNKAAFLHYLNAGQAEGRSAAPVKKKS